MIRPPHRLLGGLLLTTLTVTAVISWFGWRLHRQQQALDAGLRAEQVEVSADAVATGIRSRIVESAERLEIWVSEPGGEAPTIPGAVVAIDSATVAVYPPASLPFVPFAPPITFTSPLFVPIELDEFRGGAVAAATRYRVLATNIDPRIRAGALLRLGRALRRSGDIDGAREAYRELATLTDVQTDGLPAPLAALDGERLALREAGDHAGERRVATQIVQGIDGGAWLLDRGTAEFYRDELGDSSRPVSWTLATGLSDAWRNAVDRSQPRGHDIVVVDGRPVVVVWRANGQRAAALAAFANQYLPWPSADTFGWSLADAEGRVLAGASEAPHDTVSRVIGTGGTSWTLQLWPASGTQTTSSAGSRLLLGLVGSVLLFLWGATYFIARTIRREAQVARLQSDFVAAVSHEFRSPLTTVRQMAEMLEAGRVPTQERRQAYYRMLAGEAARLQRLVETLLNFGRMEAGVERYTFAEVGADTLVRGVVNDLQPFARDRGTTIEVEVEPSLRVVADSSALSIALSNLLDNAIKYSPLASTVSVRCNRQDSRATFDVVDRGPGIPRSEQQAIFRKFVRGRSAIETNVKGTGVGLSMVHHIVMAHGGEVRLTSEVGRGSTFTISLPTAG